MTTRPLTARVIALAVAVVVSGATAGSAIAGPTGRGSCGATAGPDGCARGSLVASCCCADAPPATPVDRPVPAGCAAPAALAHGDTGWPPVLALIPARTILAPVHGYQTVPLHTLHSTLLI